MKGPGSHVLVQGPWGTSFTRLNPEMLSCMTHLLDENVKLYLQTCQTRFVYVQWRMCIPSVAVPDWYDWNWKVLRSNIQYLGSAIRIFPLNVLSPESQSTRYAIYMISTWKLGKNLVLSRILFCEQFQTNRGRRTSFPTYKYATCTFLGAIVWNLFLINMLWPWGGDLHTDVSSGRGKYN